MPRFRLTKLQRTIPQKYLAGNVVTLKDKKAIWLIANNRQSKSRIKIIIPKKAIKNACDRNQVRRWIKELFRLRQHDFVSSDIIVIVRCPIDKLSFELCQSYLQQLIATCQPSP